MLILVLMKKYLILLIIPLIGCVNANSQKLLAGDYRIFQGSKAWELAKAIDNDDATEIKEILTKDKKLVTVVDTMYGQTLLGLAVINLKYDAVKTLLELGADPNAFNNYDGKTPMMETFYIGSRIPKTDTKYLVLLLRYGGNPNLLSKYVDYGPDPSTPLAIACNAGNFSAVKILIESGADIKKNRSHVLFNALLSGNPDLVMYLLNKGIEYSKPMSPFYDGTKITVVDMLRDWTFEIGSDDYKKKMEIVAFLKEHGIDYRSSKIPEKYYNLYSKEYLSKY